MDCCEQWKPFIAMVAVDFALAVVNILLKKVLNEGISHLLIITYRQSISAIFLAPVAYFWERLEKVNMKNKGGRAKILGMLFIKRHHGNKRWAIGSIVLTAGSIMWSSWFLMQAKIGKRYPCQYSSTALMSFFSAVQSAILVLITDWNVSKWTIKGKFEITTVVYAGIVGSGLCYVVMSWCVKQRGPVFTAAFSPFIQAFVAVFDISILHEEVHLGSVLGSTLVVAGMYILLWGKSNEAEDCVTKHLPITREDEDCSQLSQVIRVPSNLNST
ncbi:nodulin MtN21 /EamA-like transporter family protein [Actinidia rufa]|uniref:WAT1-related protein n=1 Tax=Actinidia rufa TaxID=165716 RepID=A0A7J0F4G1_9ERIC|nr:nodulin MtN21 /EamA-like transporter family protein [Actinidia rufa]